MPGKKNPSKLFAFSSGKFPSWHQNGNRKSDVASGKNYLLFKRFFDIVFSLMVILGLLSWLLPLIAILIKSGSRGPVFFRQSRVGLNGRSFTCLKFRTMVLNPDADEIPAHFNDPRITGFGRFLRKTNLDELPQFFNVMFGHMSVVGPRPHMLKDCIRFSFVISCYSFRNLVRPGITGWAQVNGCHGPTHDFDSIVTRYYWDAQYVRKLNFLLDLRILLLTVRQAVSKLFINPSSTDDSSLVPIIAMKKEELPQILPDEIAASIEADI